MLKNVNNYFNGIKIKFSFFDNPAIQGAFSIVKICTDGCKILGFRNGMRRIDHAIRDYKYDLVVAVAVEVGGDDVGTGGHQLFDGTER